MFKKIIVMLCVLPLVCLAMEVKNGPDQDFVVELNNLIKALDKSSKSEYMPLFERFSVTKELLINIIQKGVNTPTNTPTKILPGSNNRSPGVKNKDAEYKKLVKKTSAPVVNKNQIQRVVYLLNPPFTSYVQAEEINFLSENDIALLKQLDILDQNVTEQSFVSKNTFKTEKDGSISAEKVFILIKNIDACASAIASKRAVFGKTSVLCTIECRAKRIIISYASALLMKQKGLTIKCISNQEGLAEPEIALLKYKAAEKEEEPVEKSVSKSSSRTASLSASSSLSDAEETDDEKTGEKENGGTGGNINYLQNPPSKSNAKSDDDSEISLSIDFEKDDAETTENIIKVSKLNSPTKNELVPINVKKPSSSDTEEIDNEKNKKNGDQQDIQIIQSFASTHQRLKRLEQEGPEQEIVENYQPSVDDPKFRWTWWNPWTWSRIYFKKSSLKRDFPDGRMSFDGKIERYD